MESIMMNDVDIFDHLEASWNEVIVLRSRAGEASGGTISPKTCANLDSAGLGPKNRQTICAKVCYPTADFFDWLRQRNRKHSEPTLGC